MIRSLRLRLLASSLAVVTFLLTSCASTAPNAGASELVMVPWSGLSSAQQQAFAVDVSFDPIVTHAVFVPAGRSLWLEVPRGERWFVWVRGLTSGVSQVVLEGGEASMPGQEVVLISAAYISSRADSPFFGRVIHVDDFPELSVGSQKMRAVWERRGDAKENLVLELNVR